MMFDALFGYNYTRRKLLTKTNSTVMQEFLSNPFPNKKELITNVDIVSLDFETTGLDIDKDRIVSIGTVNIFHLGINLTSSSHQLISTDKELPESSVVIHQITDTQLTDAMSVDVALPILLNKLSGKIMLAHNAKLEFGFINKMCQELYGSNFVIPVIDTQYLAKRSFDRQNKAFKSNELRLFNLRKSYNMPVYKAHDALMDAIATAELFLAMVSKISPDNTARLGDFLS